jgi:GNAT superfamily N-acetyltransferase
MKCVDSAPFSFRLRRAEARDDHALGELLVESFESTYAAKMPEVVVTDRRRAELRDVASRRKIASIYVMERESDGTLVASVALFPPGAPTSEAWLPRAADLRQLAVHPNFHGHSLSKRLLEATEHEARAWGCTHICLHVRRGAVGVARLYMASGYRRDPTGDLDRLPEIYLEAYALALECADRSLGEPQL